MKSNQIVEHHFYSNALFYCYRFSRIAGFHNFCIQKLRGLLEIITERNKKSACSNVQDSGAAMDKGSDLIECYPNQLKIHVVDWSSPIEWQPKKWARLR